MKDAILTPAYGRDYTSAKDALQDYHDNKDFVYNCLGDKYDGKYCNKEQLLGREVKIRFNKKRSFVYVN